MPMRPGRVARRRPAGGQPPPPEGWGVWTCPNVRPAREKLPTMASSRNDEKGAEERTVDVEQGACGTDRHMYGPLHSLDDVEHRICAAANASNVMVDQYGVPRCDSQARGAQAAHHAGHDDTASAGGRSSASQGSVGVVRMASGPARTQASPGRPALAPPTLPRPAKTAPSHGDGTAPAVRPQVSTGAVRAHMLPFPRP